MQRAYIVHALSPLHAGTGQAQGAIDLPIARLRGTGIPYLPGSSVKGVLRDASRPRSASEDDGAVHAAFGPDVPDEEKRFAGALTFGDARLLALPIRSFKGTFAWVTSPLLLRLARRDLAWTLDVPRLTASTSTLLTSSTVLEANGHIFLEEMECKKHPAPGDLVDRWAAKIAAAAFAGDEELFTERFAIVDDETMSHLWVCCTQVDARVRIDRERGVVQDGALWYEESLPAETLLVGVAVAADKRQGHEGATLLNRFVGKQRDDLQFGGKATVGRGRARFLPVVEAQ